MYKQTALFSNSVLVFSLIILTFIGNVIPGVDYLIKYVNEFGILKYFIYFLFIVFFPSFLLFPLSFWLFKTKNLFWLIHYIIEYALYIFFIICCVYFYVCISRHNNGELGIVFFIGCFEIIGAIFTAKSFSDITNQNVKKPSLISKEQTQSTNESSMQFLVVKPKISFKDVSGMNPLKARLMEIATEHKALGKNGVLLSGDPGNGKTTMAEAVAGEMKYNFMPISISDFNAKWIGQTGEQLQEVFRCAIKNAPCVLFFDEADSFLTSREAMLEGGAANSENLKVANTFMTNINNMQGNRGVLVLVATNFKDNLDGAATRDGRFSAKIEINNPDKEARRGLILKFASNVTFEPGVLDRLLRRWDGFSVARIKAISEQMNKQSKKTGKKVFDSDDAMVALRAIQGSSGVILSEDTKDIKELRFDENDRKKLLALASRMSNIDEIEELGGKLPKGVLFTGPAGTGKTTTAKALAKSSGWAFLPTSGESLVSSPKEMDKLIAKARDLRPCIVFIDEADSILQNRESNPWGKEATNKLLAILDGVIPLNDVVFVAATNFGETLDAAAVRGGRFSELFEFRKPEQETVLALVRDWMSSKKGTPFHSDFTPEAVAKHLYGFAPADIQDKLQQSVNIAVGRIVSDEGGSKEVMINDLLAVM